MQIVEFQEMELKNQNVPNLKNKYPSQCTYNKSHSCLNILILLQFSKNLYQNVNISGLV